MKNIFFQSIDGVGSKRGSETPVNTIYVFNKDFPAITSIVTTGDIGITWLSPGYLRNSIFHQDGTVKTTPYTVGCCGADEQSISGLKGGEQVFVMQRTIDSHITAQINDGSGATLVSEYDVSASVGQDPSSSATSTGGFIVSYVCKCDSDNSLGVYFTIYTSRGVAILSNIMVV